MGVSFNKTGIISADTISEALQNPFDKQFYFESDNSVWIKIAHHNNPAAAIFLTTDSFKTSVYKDADRWFNVALCDLVSKWELMIIQALTSGATPKKYRWIQTVNPMVAEYEDVDAADVTKITTTGYTTTASYYGGLYKKADSNSYLLCNNGTQSNSWGRVGACANYKGGIAAYNNEVVTTGYMDLYLRVDNTSAVNKVSIYKDKILADSIIEV